MYKIYFTKKSYSKIDSYITHYNKYYENLFDDTGLWNLSVIRENYVKEGKEKYRNILSIIHKSLSNPIISYPSRKATIKWRSKTLLVSFYNEGDSRVITDLEIR